MATIIQSRRDTASNWASANPVLAEGELGIETDTKKFKFGDGTTAWNSLGYSAVDTITGLTASVSELNILDGATLSTTELNYVDGVTSAIQTQLNGKQDTLTQTQLDAVNSGANTTNIGQIATNTSGISSINSLIPNQATTSNQLADKNFVNSSISTNTANFIGTFNSVAELEAYSGTVTNNDYAFVVSEDVDGNTVYNRYKYTTATTPASWGFEYALNNSSFTAAQWAAINSGATTTNIGLAETSVQDVQVNGTSIVSSGAANLPIATDNILGLLKTSTSRGITTDANGVLAIANKSYSDYTSMGMTSAISKGTLENVITGKALLDNKATGTDSVGIGTSITSSDNNSVALGKSAQTGGNNAVAIGQSSKATYGSSTAIGSSAQATASAANAFGTSSQATGTGSLAVGYGAKASATYAMQLGYGTNSTANTLSVGLSSNANYQLLDSTGTIPSARLPYTSTNDAGAIKLSPSYYGTDVGTGAQEGRLIGVVYSYAGYSSIANQAFISKGTLENILTGKGLYQRSIYDGTKAIDSGSIALENSTVFYTDSPSANTTYTIDSTALTQSGLTCRYFNVLINMPSTAVGIDFTTNNTVVWAEGETPDMSTGGRTYLLAFQTFDSGTTWIGSLCTWWETPSA